MDIKDTYRDQFGTKLKQLLKLRKMSNNELSKQLNIERSNITHYISGESTPKIDIFLSICDILKVKPEFFLNESSKFKDYYSFKEKTEARKIIESIYYLCAEEIIQKPTIDECQIGRDEFKFNRYRNTLLERIADESIRYGTSDLVDDDSDFCNKIVDKYEKELYDFINKNKK